MSCGIVMDSKWKKLFCSVEFSSFLFLSRLQPYFLLELRGNYTGFHTVGSGGEVWIPLLHPHRGDEASRGLRKQGPF